MSGGFTLMELMVVVVLISIMATLAVPSMRRSRDDRIAFDYARQISGLIQRGGSRSQRHQAHLLTMTAGGAGRGVFYLFEGLDGTAPTAGPDPRGNCMDPTQWTAATTFSPGATDTTYRTRIVDGLNLNTSGVNVDADIKATFAILQKGGTSLAPVAIAMCWDASGTYVGSGADTTAAITNMQAQLQFSDVVEVKVQRHESGVSSGLIRRVLAEGGSAPFIKSE